MIGGVNKFVKYLNENYRTKKKNNSQYSLRSYARDLKISSGRLTSILHETDIPGKAVSQKIFSSLKTPVELIAEIEKDLEKARYRQQHKFDKHIPLEQLDHMGTWQSWAIYTLMQKENYPGSVEWLASTTQFSRATVLDALTGLVKLGLVELIGNEYRKAVKNITAGSDIPSQTIKKLHTEFIKRGLEALNTMDVFDRDITSMTFCMNPKQMEQAKLLICEFRGKMSNLLSSTSSDSDIYHLSVQFFPLIFQKGSSL